MFKEIEFKEPELTAIELHFLHALSVGASNKHISWHMGKSEFTVRNQSSNLLKKVNISNRNPSCRLIYDTNVSHVYTNYFLDLFINITISVISSIGLFGWLISLFLSKQRSGQRLII